MPSPKSSAIDANLIIEGLAFGESPRWHDGRLWVCNWGTGEIVAVDADGNSEIMLAIPATLPYSIDWLPDGRLLVVSGREGLLLRQEADGTLATHADLRPLSKSPWNEIVVDGRGNIYINGGGPAPAPGEHFGPGTIVLIRPDGTIRQVAENVAFANGMAVTPDNRTLIVAESHANRLTAFDIAEDGSLARRRVWADLGGDYPDGICIDAEGCVWYADVPNRHCIRVREGGMKLDRVEADRGCFACMLGGPDGRTLYIAAAEWRGFEHMISDARTGQVLSVEAPAPGAGWPAYCSGKR
ncbi:SMP-30/gluconolactonase/LRE family protein [Mesorhizobium sp. M4B.F.Ca.ET.215.01.1.1]|uniref:SMP-30/gluconolactonase/LRE family protein n=1 Tax=unclassified Mesorhizobium TaxID=325217 RepID=UPI000FD49536|nr:MULTISPECIES: SMP-30/gluconolactonase/LRE family protein [unclassified Mesorhizobium]RUW22053.1 SMP-30/gluconolactonase/LRE family protein [Mesorhizobium sp. M4B.F.Ca.ET.013.02.1.1]RWF61166.1 MAG: SMP-30/gluconolactonase/LRE family protein [Mesorhizobium sp.]TGQ13149.1 SMP-30/gluconolactonase/LRE family protein [Mesorhizobium sp. M4B.F.Ca.ET.215.01.1.1]TGQ46233.1 SMP-30/gluconolactonase/LRE family protein [Mesorhizobium sp. M00.F.Ca.ET.220.01.1.1]TGR06361.1 SMP-30/gluconolactonase/LRE famil